MIISTASYEPACSDRRLAMKRQMVLKFAKGLSCSGCLGPLCEEMDHLSVANRIASHI